MSVIVDRVLNGVHAIAYTLIGVGRQKRARPVQVSIDDGRQRTWLNMVMIVMLNAYHNKP